MPARNLVVLLDGTSNAVKQDLTNVLKLFRIAEKNANQIVFYDPGIGTIGLSDDWGRVRQGWSTFVGLTTGRGLDQNILDAYDFLCRSYRDGDRVFLLGFSRGAYTARALAGMIYLVGLLSPQQLNLSTYALNAYKNAEGQSNLRIPWRFQRVLDGRRIPIHFLGVWDSVASIIVPRRRRFYLPGLTHLPYTKTNPAVRTFRQAAAIDERRSMFRLYAWEANQPFQPDPFEAKIGEQDQQTVWFAGDHSDIGGGYPESESQAAKFALAWMAREAEAAGMRIDQGRYDHLVMGAPYAGSRMEYVAPEATAPIHNSMTSFWPALEIVPKNLKWRRWPEASHRRGIYLPLAEPRKIAESAFLHRSVVDRTSTGYRPKNLPSEYQVAETL